MTKSCARPTSHSPAPGRGSCAGGHPRRRTPAHHHFTGCSRHTSTPGRLLRPIARSTCRPSMSPTSVPAASPAPTWASCRSCPRLPPPSIVPTRRCHCCRSERSTAPSTPPGDALPTPDSPRPPTTSPRWPAPPRPPTNPRSTRPTTRLRRNVRSFRAAPRAIPGGCRACPGAPSSAPSCTPCSKSSTRRRPGPTSASPNSSAAGSPGSPCATFPATTSPQVWRPSWPRPSTRSRVDARSRPTGPANGSRNSTSNSPWRAGAHPRGRSAMSRARSPTRY